MARYTGPVCKLCRRDGVKLFLKGERCLTMKCEIERRNFPPGQHGQRRVKLSDYGLQLREKQKMRRIYGLLERQFSTYFKLADRKKGVTGDLLVQLLESRLDNVIYRIGFAASRRQARQFVSHGHISVNGRRVNVPSYRVRPGETIGLCAKSRDNKTIRNNLEQALQRGMPDWIEFSLDTLTGNIVRLPGKDDAGIPVVEQLVVELYSK